MIAVRGPAAAASGGLRTVRRGLQLSPEFRDGLGWTLCLALLATGGRVVVPIVVQRTIDEGLAGDAVAVDRVVAAVAVAVAVLAVTGVAGGWMQARLVTATEASLASLRVRTFAHIHGQSVLHQASQQRGALVARVTDDVDQISRFMEFGGVSLVSQLGQLAVATVAMAAYSAPLTLIVVSVFVPFVLLLRRLQQRLQRAYDTVRVRVGSLLGTIAESVVGADVIRAYGVGDRTAARTDRAIDEHFRARYGAIRVSAVMFASGELFAAMGTAAAVVAGVWLGVDARLGTDLTPGELVAFLFFVALFVGPVQSSVEVLDQAQTAIAGWRRILAVLGTPTDVADPPGGMQLPSGRLAVTLQDVAFTYPGGDRPAVTDLTVAVPAGQRVAVVGETGSGKSTFAKLLTRLMDPDRGTVRIGGVPVDEVAFASLRRRVVMVPQDGFLFGGTIADNVRRGRTGADDQAIVATFAMLGLSGWVDGLPQGVATPIGERGRALSTGERQLVALARAAIADPDLLILDEATSAVDPATEVRVAGALERLLESRTAVVVAHRLSTAERADRVLVFDAGRVVQDGPHERLVATPGVYAALHAEWAAASHPVRDAS